MTNEELKNRFVYHPPKEGQPLRYSEIRSMALKLARLINDECPESQEKDNTIMRVEEAVMWANASIARHG